MPQNEKWKKGKFSYDCFFSLVKQDLQLTARTATFPSLRCLGVNCQRTLYCFLMAFTTNTLYNYWCDGLSNGCLLHSSVNVRRPEICHSPAFGGTQPSSSSNSHIFIFQLLVLKVTIFWIRGRQTTAGDKSSPPPVFVNIIL